MLRSTDTINVLRNRIQTSPEREWARMTKQWRFLWQCPIICAAGRAKKSRVHPRDRRYTYVRSKERLFSFGCLFFPLYLSLFLSGVWTFFALKTKRLRRTVNTVTHYLDCYPSASAGRETAWVINQRQSNSGSVGSSRLPTGRVRYPSSLLRLKPGKKRWWVASCILPLRTRMWIIYENHRRRRDWLSPARSRHFLTTRINAHLLIRAGITARHYASLNSRLVHPQIV